MRVRGSADEPAGDWLNDLPQGVICSRRRLVWVCFHARRGYGKTGKATLPFKTLGVGRPPRLRARLFTPCLWDGSETGLQDYHDLQDLKAKKSCQSCKIL